MLAPVRAETLLGMPVSTSRWQAVVMISPEKAKLLIDAQPINRPVNRVAVEKLKQDILAGRWRRTHQGIAFDEDGALSDGQHRLHACFEAGFPIEVLVAFNEPRELFPAYDTGVLRGMNVHLFLSGAVSDMTAAGSVAPATRFLWGYDSGTNPATANTKRGFTLDMARAVLAAHPRLPEMVAMVRAKRTITFPLANTAALFTLFHEADEKRAAIFAAQVLTGENIKSGDPAFVLREATMRDKSRGSIETSYRTVRAWNAFYEGRPLFKIYGSKTASKETRVRTMDVFPEVAGYKRAARGAA